MEAYPDEYVEHNLPLVLLSGLGEHHDEQSKTSGLPRQESGTRIQASSPQCSGERAQILLQHFLQIDGSSQAWNTSALPGPSGKLKYKVKAVGRIYTLPPRKAAPLAQATSLEGSQKETNGPQRSVELHSPLSPLSPGSPIYPDGVFSPLWLAKHQQQVPALFIAFFSISAGGNSSQDDQLKSDINAIRAALNKSGFKTKFAAVLISDKSILQAPEMEDRLSSIRRTTTLDSKTGLFLMPPMSPIEIGTFVQGILTTLQPSCVDYYRDLTKHARRKKGRAGSAPPTSISPDGSAQPLSVSGWNLRYEVKQGVFAEFRQEMETAERHYSAAIDELFGTEGILETYSTTSPRWTEARLLCDGLALRILRCQLWTSSTSAAAQSWVNYKLRVADLMSHRGKDLQSSEWENWKAGWGEIMAQLIVRAGLPAFIQSEKQSDASSDVSPQHIYAMPEKSVAAVERMPPFQYLHHAGYWFNLAIRGGRARQRGVPKRTDGQPLSNAAMPQEDTHSSGNQQADKTADIKRRTEAAAEQFGSRSQIRMTDLVKLDLAHDFADAKRHDEALDVLLPLWNETTWRNEGWHDLLTDLLLLLRQCAELQSNLEVIVGTTYELLSARSSLASELSLDLTKCLDGVREMSSVPISLKILDQQRLSPIAVSFAFETKDTHVGEPLGCQLVLTSSMNDKSELLTLSSVMLWFGSSRSVKITHDSVTENPAREYVDLFNSTTSNDGTLEARACLTVRPAERRIFRFTLTHRDAEILRLDQAIISIETDKFTIEHSFTDGTLLASDSIFVETEHQLERKFLRSTDTTAVTVLPKPPKVQLLLHGLRKEYYVDETVRVVVEIINEEAETVNGTANAQISGEEHAHLSLKWAKDPESSNSDDKLPPTSEAPVVNELPTLKSGQSHKLTILMSAPPTPLKTAVEIWVDYTLSTDKDSSLRKSTTLELKFAAPFEGKFNFGPLLYPHPWPSYFDPHGEVTSEKPGGIPQLWRLHNQLRCLAIEPVVLRTVQVVLDSVSGDSWAQTKNEDPEEQHPLRSGQLAGHSFELQTQKHSLDDRRPTIVESMLEVTWSRDKDTNLVTTRIPIPRLTLPVSEPRVLCTLSANAPDNCDAVLQYHIENPSNHFLTFALTMEASEEFAFSGPKYRALSLAPLSRHPVDYRIALHDDGDGAKEDGRWIWPALQVVDSYYQKTLRVHPGGSDVKLDEKLNIGVWIETK